MAPRINKERPGISIYKLNFDMPACPGHIKSDVPESSQDQETFKAPLNNT